METRPAEATGAGQNPADWPDCGPLDLSRHECPHDSATLEWWYVNAHLATASGAELSLFAAFFRRAVDHDEAEERYVYAHALTWAMIDPAGRRYMPESLVDPAAPAIARGRLAREDTGGDSFLRRALAEIVDRDHVPLPDQLMRAPARVGRDHLDLDYDGRSFRREPDGGYRLSLTTGSGDLACNLHLTPQKPFVRHGEDGVVAGRQGERMFYYFCPRLSVRGTVCRDGTEEPVVHGSAWYDHEFGHDPRASDDWRGDAGEAAPPPGRSWDWLSAQLDDGGEWSLYALRDPQTGESAGRFAVEVAPDGEVRRYTDFSLTGDAEWTSSKTFVTHPTAWRLQVPAAGVELMAEADFPHQEFVTLISKPSFWEGRVRLHGTVRGRAVSGLGFVERAIAEEGETIDDFLRAVSKAARACVRAVLPLDLDAESAATVVARAERTDYLEGLDLRQVSRALIEPVRTVVDRGGKAWRSYALLACCDAVGGDSQPLLRWLALPELVHVGSLIVDDVEDRSVVRRGGPATHHLYGEALAINAGTACYFWPQAFVRHLDIPDADKVRLYELYFEAARAAHTGQALDIDGYGHAMPDVVRTGDGLMAERHVRAVHRLKSGVPASCLARIGALLGGASPEQEAAVGGFFDAVGVAFQIVDDALNLSGFSRDLKQRGEDVTEGKVTMPVAKAMSRLDAAGRARLWQILSARPAEPGHVHEAISLIEECGAIRACREEADQLIEAAWARLQPLLPDSRAKLMLRAFGHFVLDRVY